MQKHKKNSNRNTLVLQTWNAVLLFVCMACIGTANAGTLPLGKCTDPKPKTDLRHCRFEGADLRNKDLQGTDLRGISFHKAQLQGANLTNAVFDGDGIMFATLDNVQGLSQEAVTIYEKNYLVTSNRNLNSAITLSLHAPVQGIQKSIAGLANIHMVKKMDKLHTLAVLDWPRYGEGGMMTIISRFDNDNFGNPTCSQSVNLLKDEQYYYPNWDSMKVMKLENDGYLIGVKAQGRDSDGEGVSGYEMVALLKLSTTCRLTLLHKEDSGWAEGENNTGCQGDHLSYRFLDERSAEIIKSAHMCGIITKSNRKVSYKKIKLN